MMEYIFFDAGLRDRFVGYARSMGVESSLQDDNMGWVVAVPEELADDLVESLEMHYDELQEEQSALLSQSQGGLKQLAGFRLVLPDGQTRMVPLQPDVAKRLLSCFSFEEIQSLFDTVARSALSQKNMALCEILRAGAEAS